MQWISLKEWTDLGWFNERGLFIDDNYHFSIDHPRLKARPCAVASNIFPPWIEGFLQYRLGLDNEDAGMISFQPTGGSTSPQPAKAKPPLSTPKGTRALSNPPDHSSNYRSTTPESSPPHPRSRFTPGNHSVCASPSAPA